MAHDDVSTPLLGSFLSRSCDIPAIISELLCVISIEIGLALRDDVSIPLLGSFLSVPEPSVGRLSKALELPDFM